MVHTKSRRSKARQQDDKETRSVKQDSKYWRKEPELTRDTSRVPYRYPSTMERCTDRERRQKYRVSLLTHICKLLRLYATATRTSTESVQHSGDASYLSKPLEVQHQLLGIPVSKLICAATLSGAVTKRSRVLRGRRFCPPPKRGTIGRRCTCRCRMYCRMLC